MFLSDSMLWEGYFDLFLPSHLFRIIDIFVIYLFIYLLTPKDLNSKSERCCAVALNFIKIHFYFLFLFRKITIKYVILLIMWIQLNWKSNNDFFGLHDGNRFVEQLKERLGKSIIIILHYKFSLSLPCH